MSDAIKVGIAGFGFMGRTHAAAWNVLGDNTRLSAIYLRDAQKLNAKAEGNIEGQGEELELSDVEIYTDYQEMLDKAGLDAVSITLPTFLHADYAVQA
ncbi:hypothetical protein BVX97_00055, partial [bacterium E08(2017)]